VPRKYILLYQLVPYVAMMSCWWTLIHTSACETKISTIIYECISRKSIKFANEIVLIVAFALVWFMLYDFAENELLCFIVVKVSVW